MHAVSLLPRINYFTLRTLVDHLTRFVCGCIVYVMCLCSGARAGLVCLEFDSNWLAMLSTQCSVIARGSVNRSTEQTLAKVFAPLLLRPKKYDAIQALEHQAYRIKVISHKRLNCSLTPRAVRALFISLIWYQIMRTILKASDAAWQAADTSVSVVKPSPGSPHTQCLLNAFRTPRLTPMVPTR
jgi:hypothetical protein